MNVCSEHPKLHGEGEDPPALADPRKQQRYGMARDGMDAVMAMQFESQNQGSATKSEAAADRAAPYPRAVENWIRRELQTQCDVE